VAETGSRWFCFGKDFGPRKSTALRGEHQERNAGVAAAVAHALCETFPVSPDDVAQGIARARWPGRLELFDGKPAVIVDAAHNPEAAECLRAARSALAPSGPRVLLFGVMADKAWGEMLSTLAPAFDHVVLVPVQNPRSLDPRLARAVVHGIRPCEVADCAAEGLERARDSAGAAGTVVVAGSIFLVAELYRACGGAEDPFADAR
jgi:dihydrofolate synthase/folylpolyglutamate synthase